MAKRTNGAKAKATASQPKPAPVENPQPTEAQGSSEDEPKALEGDIIPPEQGSDGKSLTAAQRLELKHRFEREWGNPVEPLSTVGDIKRAMGRVYRRAKRGKIKWKDASRAVYVLRQILATVEVELQHQLDSHDPDADRPTFSGLQMIGPGAITSNGNSTHQKEGSDNGKIEVGSSRDADG